MERGQSLIEVLIASAIFILGISAIAFLVLDANVASRQGVERTQAILLAKEGLEAARSMRDGDFDNVTAGAHGIALSGNRWVFSGVSDTPNQFTRVVNVTDIDIDTKKIQSTVTWQFTQTRQNSVVLVDYLTDWNQSHGNAGERFVISVSNAQIADKELRDVFIENTGSSAITIDKIAVSWTNTANKIEEIVIGGTKVWSKDGPGTPSGVQSSGTLLDIQNYTLGASSGAIKINKITFNNNMADNNFVLKFIMTADASTKYALVDFSGGDAASLIIDLASAFVADKELRNVKLQNTGSVFLSIDKITPTWTASSAKIEEIVIGGTKVWSKDGPGTPSGVQRSGIELNIKNYRINPGATVTIDKFKFDRNMMGATFDITFKMGNGSSKSTGNFAP